MAHSFAKDIRPLFRDKDVSTMKEYGLNLSSFDDVKKHAHDIHSRLKDGDMPCDGAWPAADVTKFKEWVDGGMAA